MNRGTVASILLAVALACGCSSAPRVTDVSNWEDKKVIEGFPFRVRVPQSVQVFKLSADGTSYEEVSATRDLLADRHKLYAIDAVSLPFSSPALKVTHAPDNTLKVVKLTTTNSADKGLEAINTAVSSVTKAQSDKAAAALTGNSAIATAEKAVRDAQKDLDSLVAGTPDSTRAAYQAYLDSAKRQANAAYRAAGLPPPY